MGVKKRGLSKLNLILVASVIIIVIGVGFFTYNFILKGGEASEMPNSLSVQCQNQCDIGSKTGFCEVERKVNENLFVTCEELSKDDQYIQYDVQPCSTISCVLSSEEAEQQADQTCVSGLGGTWEDPTSDGTCPQEGVKIVREVEPSDNPPIQGQICCR